MDAWRKGRKGRKVDKRTALLRGAALRAIGVLKSANVFWNDAGNMYGAWDCAI